MEEELKLVSRLQKKAAHDAVIQRYDYLVKHVKTIHILPHLVSSKLAEPDFHQYLDGERTERNKKMALLRELLSSPMEDWFRDFIGALSKYPPCQTVVDILLISLLAHSKVLDSKKYLEYFLCILFIVHLQIATKGYLSGSVRVCT